MELRDTSTPSVDFRWDEKADLRAGCVKLPICDALEAQEIRERNALADRET